MIRSVVVFIAAVLLVTGFEALPSSAVAEGPVALAVQGADSCLVQVPGDLNLSGTVTSADIIYLVNFVFLTGPPPQPCVYAGDVSCSGQVSSADIIWIVNFIFKSGPQLCNVCDSATPYDCVQ